MITSLRRLVGMPVIWQDRQLGFVEQALPDGRMCALGGLMVRRGISGAKWCPAEEIAVLGTECVVISSRPRNMPPWKPQSALSACLTTGQCIGEVTDAILRDGSANFAALEISPGAFYRLLGRCAYACDYRSDPASGCVMIPQLLTWTQLKRRLGEEDDG